MAYQQDAESLVYDDGQRNCRTLWYDGRYWDCKVMMKVYRDCKVLLKVYWDCKLLIKMAVGNEEANLR